VSWEKFGDRLPKKDIRKFIDKGDPVWRLLHGPDSIVAAQDREQMIHLVGLARMLSVINDAAAREVVDSRRPPTKHLTRSGPWSLNCHSSSPLVAMQKVVGSSPIWKAPLRLVFVASMRNLGTVRSSLVPTCAHSITWQPRRRRSHVLAYSLTDRPHSRIILSPAGP
jgi:hypothetical protein